jgi:N-ethylmaleimide reductase
VRLAPNGVYGSQGSHDNHDMFLFLARRLRPLKLGYLHLMDGLGFGFHNKCPPVTLFEFKREYGEGTLVGNVCYTRDLAEGAIRTGAVDAIAFGRPYISNPDLVERFAQGLSVAPDPPMSAWYGDGGVEGYTDWPVASAVGNGDGGVKAAAL